MGRIKISFSTLEELIFDCMIKKGECLTNIEPLVAYFIARSKSNCCVEATLVQGKEPRAE